MCNIKKIYEDEYYLAVYKEAGILVYKNEYFKNEITLKKSLKQKTGKSFYPLYNIEKAASGIILFSKNDKITSKTLKSFEKNKVKFEFKAIVRGHLEYGIIEKPLKILKKGINAKIKAITEYETMEKFEIPIFVDKYPTTRYSLVRIIPQENLHHQIRQHFKIISHPILGDTTYGKKKHNDFLKKYFNISRLMLSNTEINFKHPFTNENIKIKTDYDNDFINFIKKAEKFFIIE